MKTKHTNYTIAAYAAFASCFLGAPPAGVAQVVHIDIDPDVIIDEPLEGLELDLDLNGGIDFAFQNVSYTYYYWYFGTHRLLQAIDVMPNNSMNALAGNSGRVFHYGISYTYYYPFALLNGDIINSGLTWQDDEKQQMAVRAFKEAGGLVSWNGDYANWFNEEEGISQTINGYLGVRFVDNLEQNHYGWIRCDVKDEGRTLVIKDYAYETEPDYPIVAGDTAHYVGISNLQNTIAASVYSFNKIIYIQVSNLKEMRLVVTDLAGKELLIADLQSGNETINMNKYPTDLYIVTLLQDNKRFVKKVMIE